MLMEAHQAWYQMQRCKDRFEGLLKIDQLRAGSPPATLPPDPPRLITGRMSTGGKHAAVHCYCLHCYFHCLHCRFIYCIVISIVSVCIAVFLYCIARSIVSVSILQLSALPCLHTAHKQSLSHGVISVNCHILALACPLWLKLRVRFVHVSCLQTSGDAHFTLTRCKQTSLNSKPACCWASPLQLSCTARTPSRVLSTLHQNISFQTQWTTLWLMIQWQTCNQSCR